MLAQPDAIYIMDGSNLTSSAPIVVPTNLMVRVCFSMQVGTHNLHVPDWKVV